MSTYSSRKAHLDLQRLARPSLKARLQAMWLAYRTRRLLATMDDRMLADIGIGRGDAQVEAARPMWRIETLR